MSTDLKLDPETHDLYIESGDLQRVTESDEVIQSSKIRLLHIQGEWVFDYTLGVPWLTEMFSTEVTDAQKSSILRQTILETEHVRRIIQFEFFLDPIERSAQIEYSADSDFGPISTELLI